MIKKFDIYRGNGKYRIYMEITLTDNGLLVQLLGGEKPHLGAVVISVPRPSLANPASTSCTSTVVPLPGHKDDEIAKPVAEALARTFNQPVAVAAGLHIKNATAEDINVIINNCNLALSDITNKINSNNTPDKN